MTPEEFRRHGHALIDWIANYRNRLEHYPVMSQANPGQIKACFAPLPPQEGLGLDGLLAEVERNLMPGITHWQHPSFFAYFPANAPLSSVLADLLATGLGVQGMSWQTSPAATELEEVVVEWLRQMVGLPPSFSGVIHDTASTACLTALMCAREHSTQHSQNQGGLQSLDKPLVVYASAEAHSSVMKAALLAGFGRHNVRMLPTDSNHAMLVPALQEAIHQDLIAGKQPCAVVVSVGTTGTTAIDPLSVIAPIAKAHSMWVHVDAAMAGTAMILPECRWMWEGVEMADSVNFNPHKWLGAAFDCSLYYVQDPQHLIRVMSTNPSYLRTEADGQVKNFRDWGIPLGRRFRSLKLWMLLLDEGVQGLQARIRRDLDNAKWLAQQVDQAAGWQRLAPVPLQTVCVRYEPPGLIGDELDRFTLGWVAKINHSGQAYLTPSMLQGRWMVRVSVGSETTQRQHVEALWQQMQHAVQ